MPAARIGHSALGSRRRSRNPQFVPQSWSSAGEAQSGADQHLDSSRSITPSLGQGENSGTDPNAAKDRLGGINRSRQPPPPRPLLQGTDPRDGKSSFKV